MSTESEITLNFLPKSTSGLLSSGQIITSVYTAVKELVENSLDAGADVIEIRLTDHGLTRLSVRDNGSGVAECSVPLMVTSHTTSKIADFSDLRALATYGFRGEALNALCGLSEVEIETKRRTDSVGRKFTFDASGGVKTSAPLAMNPGTTVVAKNIFHNLPVRRNLYKKGNRKKEELKRVEYFCKAYGIVRPALRISLWHNQSVVFQKQNCADIQGGISQVFGGQVFRSLDLVKFKHEEMDVSVEMYLPKGAPTGVRVKGEGQTFTFVNSRPVEIKEVTKMLKRIFVDMKIPVGTANAVVSIIVPPVTLDVNLEPSKLSVFIEGQERLFEALQDKARSHFGLDGDENAPPNNSSPQNQEHRLESQPALEPQPALVANVQESPSVVERRHLPPEATAAPEKRPRGEAEAESSLLSEKSLSMSSSGDASFVEVSWATGQQESARANALSTVKQLSIDSWATGKAILSERTGIPVVPVAMVVGKEPPKRSHVSASPASSNRSREFQRAFPPTKKSKASQLDETDSRLEDFLLKMEKKKENMRREFDNKASSVAKTASKGTPHLTGQKRAKISRRIRTVRFSQEAILKSNEDSLCAPNVVNGVIGRLKVSPHWICQSGGDIYALNHHRFEEVAIFDRLLGSRMLNTVDLPEPKVLDDDKSWNGALNETLLNMPRAEAGLVTDERVRTNGFAVKVRKDGLGGILVGVPRDVNFMGPAELTSILESIKVNANVSVCDSRPLKIRSFLQAEAVRMVRQNPPGIDLETVRKMWSSICGKLLKGHEIPQCLHGRPMCQLLTTPP